jgi:hypothetical protein
MSLEAETVAIRSHRSSSAVAPDNNQNVSSTSKGGVRVQAETVGGDERDRVWQQAVRSYGIRRIPGARHSADPGRTALTNQLHLTITTQ